MTELSVFVDESGDFGEYEKHAPYVTYPTETLVNANYIMDGNNVNITLFANSMTENGHQRDEYAFIRNALYAALLTETRY